MPRRGTVFVHVPLSHTFTIQVAEGDGGLLYVCQAGRTCGLREGDIMVGVDGASTTRWPLALLQQTLRKASRDVVVEVLREMGDSAASVRAGGTELGTATLKHHHHHHAVTKAEHEAEDMPVVSENGKVESCVESPQGAPASPASPSASPPCSQSMTPAAAPDTEAQTVTSSQTSHTRTSFESAVSVQGAGGGVQGAVQSQGVQNLTTQSQAIHSQSIQTGSVSQSLSTTINGHQPIQTSTTISGQQTLHSVSQSQSAQSVSQSLSSQTVVQSQAVGGFNGQPPSVLETPAVQPRVEPHSVDENANSIQKKVPAQPQSDSPEPAPEGSVAQEATEEPVSAATLEPTVVPEQVAVTEPAVVPESAATPEPTVVPETELAATPEPAVVPEPAATPEPTVVPEPAAAPEPAVVPEPAATPEPAVVPESAAALDPALPPESTEALEPAAIPEAAAALESAVELELAVAPESAAAPGPIVDPEPVVLEEPAAVSESTKVPEEAGTQEPAVPLNQAETMADAQESAPPHEPGPHVAAEETVVPEPLPTEEPLVEEAPRDVAPEPVPAVEPEPLPEAEPVIVHEPEPSVETTLSGSGGGPVVEEISQEHIKEQLHEIITEIEQQVLPEQEQEQQQQQQEVQQGGGGGGVAKRHTKPSEEAQPVVGEAGRPLEAEEVEYYDEDGVLHHTWKPRGKYEVPKTVIQYEDVVPIAVPDVAFSLKAQPPKPAPPPQPEPPKPQPQPKVETRHEPSNLTNGAVSPIEIPEGIPLLARILPKDHEDGEKKISLERLFTPATDSGDLTPKTKKAFSSSAFYRPDHPTIDDQVELAQRISFSLVDENNKMSRGQSMYMKRKKRSMRWIHAGGANNEDASGAGEGGEGQEEEHTLKHPPAAHLAAPVPAIQQADTKKPPMKLLMSPKGVQDFHAVQEHYQALMEAVVPTSPEVCKIVTEVQSPTGKGAELFAKRKKRMDKFIVDETTVQKAQTPTRTLQQQQPSSTITNDLAFKKSAVEERNRQQQQIMEQFLRSREESLTLVKSPWQAAMETGTPDAAFDDKRQRLKSTIYKPASSDGPELANTVCERADTKLAQAASWLEPPKSMPLMGHSLDAEMIATPAASASGSFTLPDLTKILTQPSKPKSSEPKLEPNKPKPVPPKPKAWLSVNRAGNDDSPTPALRGGSQRTPATPALTSPPSRHHVCSPKPLPLPPTPRICTPPQPFLSASKPSCKFNKSQAVTHPDGSRSAVPPKLTVDATGSYLAPRPASASMTASGRFPARPVAFPKPMQAVASPGMKHFIVSSPRASVESPKQAGTNVHNTSPSSHSLTPSCAPQNLKHGGDSSLPESRVLSSVSTRDCGGGGDGGAFKIFTSGSDRPNSVPAYLPASPPSLPFLSNMSPPPVPPRNNCPTPPNSVGEKEIKLKPGTPPLYVFPDGTEVTYLNENAMNHHTEDCALEETRQECYLHPDSSKDPSAAAIDILTHDSGTTSCLFGVNTEVSRRVEGTVHSTRIDNLSTHLHESTGTNTCHLKVESHIRNRDRTSNSNSIHINSRPARPTSLPLISLSSLVNNTSPASPASLPCNPASSPLVSAAYPGARSFSDIALPQNPLDSVTSFPCVVAADPSVGSQVGGVSVLTGASPPPRSLPAPSSTPPSHAPVALVLEERNSDVLNPQENEYEILPIKVISQKLHKENSLELETDRRYLHLQTSCPVSLSEDKEPELHVTTAEGSTGEMKVSSSCAMNEDILTTMTDKILTRSHDEEHHLDGHQSEADLSNFSQGIPLIEISNEPRKSSLDEEELRKFMEDIKMSFQNAPSVIDTIEVKDLKPPEYYRSVSRSSMDQELEEPYTADGPDHLAETSGDASSGRGNLLHADAQDEGNVVSDKGDKKIPFEPPPCADASDSVNESTSHPGGDESRGEMESCDARGVRPEALIKDITKDLDNAQSEEEQEDEGEGRGHVDEEVRPRFSFSNCMVFTRRCSLPTNESPSPPLSPPPASTNPPTPSAGPAAIYSAEVKVVQRSSLPPTPAPDVPRSMLSPEGNSSDKRNSASFNMAAKGWGTYANFYKPITFAT